MIILDFCIKPFQSIFFNRMAICAFLVAGFYLFWLNTIIGSLIYTLPIKKLHAYILVLSILYCIAGYFRRALIFGALILWFLSSNNIFTEIKKFLWFTPLWIDLQIIINPMK